MPRLHSVHGTVLGPGRRPPPADREQDAGHQDPREAEQERHRHVAARVEDAGRTCRDREDADDEAAESEPAGQRAGDERRPRCRDDEDPVQVTADDESGAAQVVERAGEVRAERADVQLGGRARGRRRRLDRHGHEPGPEGDGRAPSVRPLRAAEDPVEVAEERQEEGESQDLHREADRLRGRTARLQPGQDGGPVLRITVRRGEPAPDHRQNHVDRAGRGRDSLASHDFLPPLGRGTGVLRVRDESGAGGVPGHGTAVPTPVPNRWSAPSARWPPGTPAWSRLQHRR